MQRKFKKFISVGITLAMLGTTPCIPFASFAAEINKAMTISDIFIASKKTTVKIIKQPQSVTVAKGEKAVIKLSATGEDLIYDWYYRNPGKSYFEYTSTFKENSYTISSMDERRNGRQVYCVITDKFGNSVQSETVTLTMINEVFIIKQPQDVICDENEVIKFTVEAIGVGALEYQWQYFEPALSDWGWQNIIGEYAEYGGCYTDTLVIDDIGYAGDCSFRCIITDENGNSVTSEPVSARLILKISEQPENSNCSIGQTAKFTVNPIGGSGSYSYQWQCGSLNGERFEYNNISTYSWASGGNTATLSELVSNYRLYETYRCIITDMETGEKVISDEASIA